LLQPAMLPLDMFSSDAAIEGALPAGTLVHLMADHVPAVAGLGLVSGLSVGAADGVALGTPVGAPDVVSDVATGEPDADVDAPTAPGGGLAGVPTQAFSDHSIKAVAATPEKRRGDRDPAHLPNMLPPKGAGCP